MIKVDSLSYIYNHKNPYQTTALDDLSFTINQGEIIGIIGPSGSGKSCLLRCLAGILTPTAGKISFEYIGSANPEIGLIIQEPEIQFFNETVYQEIAFALQNRGLNLGSVDEIVKSTIQKIGYNGGINLSPFRLSGGEQRRVAIATILALNPHVLLMDEPTVGLDFNGLKMVSQIIDDYRAERKTVIIVSHDMDFLYRCVNRFFVLARGKLVADFDKNGFGNNIELLNEIGLSIPEIVEVKNKALPVDIMAKIMNLGL